MILGKPCKIYAANILVKNIVDAVVLYRPEHGNRTADSAADFSILADLYEEARHTLYMPVMMVEWLLDNGRVQLFEWEATLAMQRETS